MKCVSSNVKKSLQTDGKNTLFIIIFDYSTNSDTGKYLNRSRKFVERNSKQQKLNCEFVKTTLVASHPNRRRVSRLIIKRKKHFSSLEPWRNNRQTKQSQNFPKHQTSARDRLRISWRLILCTQPVLVDLAQAQATSFEDLQSSTIREL